MDRRSFVLGGLAALVALSTPNVVDKGVEMVARAGAEEHEKAPISEAEFNRLMAYNTVDDILSEYGIGSVDDASYKRKVYDSDKHVMVLFYNNKAQGSKGLSILVALLGEKWSSNFDILGYKMSEEQNTPPTILQHVYDTYGVRKTPAIVLYKNSELPTANEKIVSGITTFDNLNRMFNIVAKYINSNII